MRAATELRQIHGQMVKYELLFHPVVAGRFVSVFPILEGTNRRDCLLLYAQMVAFIGHLHGLELSLPSVLRHCGKASGLEEGRQIHAQVLKTYFKNDPFISNSILRMYLDLGEVEVARRVFDTMPKRDVISWNSMISGCINAGAVDFAYRVFEVMPQKDLISVNAMIDGLMKCGSSHLALQLFENLPERDVFTWTSMISGYVINGSPKNALEIFREMLCACIAPDVPAIVNVLSAIADLGFADEGKRTHAFVCRNDMDLDSGNLASAFIEMYSSKCGLIGIALAIFQSISCRRRVGDWNSMMSGLAFHGLGRETLNLFREMQRMKVSSDEVTFLAILNACSHSGLVDEGLHFFQLMNEKFKIKPNIKHYGCLIHLLG
ncbi:hypothetical protein KFK09_025761 [Dendrobium nobile]|uniref:Pentatricopeptide repeat-containing protein n=1 Tax=Dendrobium nobile TaxID=94219 RepID=A0A8T3A6H3_DENNO|nr:hypothetical protein KFK09_025761 [Dendrobium nobile]